MSMGPFLMVGPVAGAKSATCVNPALVQLINDYGTKIYDHNLFLEDFREKN